MATLSLRQNNPYATGFIIEQENRSLLKRPILVYPDFTQGDESHILKECDYLWDIAYKFYGDSKLWWVLRDVNNIFNPFELTIGHELIIPSLETVRALL